MFEFLGVADWLVWYMISQYVALVIFGVYLLYTTRLKIGFKAVFVRRASKEGSDLSDIDIEYGYSSSGSGSYMVVGEKGFKPTDESVSFKKKTFVLDLGYSGYRKFGYTYYFFDFDEGSSLVFGGEKEGVDAELIDIFTNSGVIAQLVRGIRGIEPMMLAMIIIAVVGVGVSCFFGGYFLGMSNGTVTF